MAFCTDCGADTKAAKFCGECGAKVEVKAEPSKQPQQQRKFVVHARNEKPKPKLDDTPLDTRQRRAFNEHQKESYAEGYGNIFNYGDVQIPKEVDLSGEDLKTAWKQLTQGKIDWLLFGFQNLKENNVIEVKSTGQKGLKEFAAQFQNYQHTMLFGCIRIVGKDRVGGVSTNRVKYVYVTFVGNGVPELSRAQFNPLKAQVERFFGVVQLTVHMTGSSIDLDLSPNQLGFRLQNSSGSHKSEIFDFGGGLEVDAASFTHADSDEEESEMSDF